MRSSAGGAANDFRFAGEQLDDETGLYYLRARYYDPSLGRFTSHDPLSGSLVDPQTQNPYVYATNNPIGLADPSGMGSYGPAAGQQPIREWTGQDTEQFVTIMAMAAPEAVAVAEVGIFSISYLIEGDAVVEAEVTGERLGAECELGAATRSLVPPNAPVRGGGDPWWTTSHTRLLRIEAATSPEQWSEENLERMRRGLVPLDSTGAKYNVHHINGRDIPDPHNAENLMLVTREEDMRIHFGH